MRRRTCLHASLLALAWLATGGHTPYGQWQVYRRRHLLIGTSRADPASYPLGQRIAHVLATNLPESSARVARGPDAWRLASLLTSEQFEVILLTADEVTALRYGRPPFEAFGATPLRSLFSFGDHWLICRPDFPGHHAWLVVETLAIHGDLMLGGSPPDPARSPVTLHEGELALLRGEPMPVPVTAAGAAPPAR